MSTRFHSEIVEIAAIQRAAEKLIPRCDFPSLDFTNFCLLVQRRLAVRHRIVETSDPPIVNAQSTAQMLRDCVPEESAEELFEGAEDGEPHYQLMLADCYMFGMKGIPRDSDRACKLYYDAAYAGEPEACVAVAIICYLRLVGLQECDPPVPRIPSTDARYSVLQQMWYFLDAAAERDWISPFYLRTIMDAQATGSWTLSEVSKRAYQKRMAQVENEKADEDYLQVRCARSGCGNRLSNTAQLKQCGRCRAVSYCSIGCQHVDWRESHKDVCKLNNTTAPIAQVNQSATEKTSRPSVMATFAGMSISSSTLTADCLNSCANGLLLHQINALCAVRGHPGLPPLEYNELKRQADELFDRQEYSSAKRCLTRASDDLWLSKPLFGGDTEDRKAMLPILRLRIQCCLALAEKRLSESEVECALEDLEQLLATGIFPLEEIEPDVLKDLQNMEAQAKLLKTRLSYALPEQAPQQRTRKSKNSKKKKQSTKKSDGPTLIVTPTEKLVSLGVAKNAVFADDGCTICLTAWNEFTTLTLAAVPPCKHATCAPCLARFHKACKTSFASDTTTERAKISFACVLCRTALSDSLITSVANVSIQRNLVPAFKEIPHHLGVTDGDDRRRLLTCLLTAHDFDLAQVTDILFSMVGVVSTTKSLTHDDKQRNYEAAREPVRKLVEEHQKLRQKLAASYESDHPDWKATFARARIVSDALEKARENAAADIYERMNADGRMGATDGRDPVQVDLHGLHVEEARRALTDFVFPTLPVLKSVHVITGKGTHSKDGEGVLRELVKTLAVEKGFRVEKTRNNGVLCVKV